MTQPPHKDAILASAIYHDQFLAFSKAYQRQDDGLINDFYRECLTDEKRQLVGYVLDEIENAPRDHAVALKYGLQREMLKFADVFMQGKTQNA